MKKLISFCFLTFCLPWPTAKNGNGKDNKGELKACAEWLGCVRLQTVGGMAQVGRSWEGGGRGKGRGEEGGYRLREREERDTYAETQTERWGDRGRATEKQRQTEREDRNTRVYGRSYTHAQR